MRYIVGYLYSSVFNGRTIAEEERGDESFDRIEQEVESTKSLSRAGKQRKNTSNEIICYTTWHWYLVHETSFLA